jgi:4-diphosphocytidyl-2-C-methyl-D-erythritol kinase
MEDAMQSVRVLAPGKINLHLELLGRRADGYHDLETVFQTIALHDTVRIDRRPDGPPGIRLVVIGPGSAAAAAAEPGAPAGAASASAAPVPHDQRNLAWRAAHAFIGQRAGSAGALTITLDKHLPVGAGLGGGSSDAAAVLRGLAVLLPGWHGAAICSPLCRR